MTWPPGGSCPLRLRRRAVTPLRFLLAAPYLLFAFPLSLPVAVGAAAIASTGFASTLLLQEQLIALTGEDVRGQALGLHATGMKAMQAIGATLAGLTAQFLPPGPTITMLAVASIAVTVTLSPGLRLSNSISQAQADPQRTALVNVGGLSADLQETTNEQH